MSQDQVTNTPVDPREEARRFIQGNLGTDALTLHLGEVDQTTPPIVED